ncbi:hypothetical protein B0H14DRAFT_2652802, partial [Mycena olivaceomarginata]
MQDDNYSLAPLLLFNGRTPRLRSCSLTSFNFGWDVRLVSHLRVLKLGGYFNLRSFNAPPAPGILRGCPELEELALCDLSDVDCAPCFSDSDSYEFPQLTKVVHLPRLKKVSFYYAGIALTQQLMAQFTFPNLEFLELCYLENVYSVFCLVPCPRQARMQAHLGRFRLNPPTQAYAPLPTPLSVAPIHLEFRIHEEPTPIDDEPRGPAVGTFEYDLASGKFQTRWDDWTQFQQWLREEEQRNCIELRLVNTYHRPPAYERKHRSRSRHGTGGVK